MKTEPKLPMREPRAPVISSPVWTDLSEDEARAHILGGGSLWVSGQAGTGKSHFLLSAHRDLQKSGKKVARTAKTHAASARIDGHTLDSWTRRSVMKGYVNTNVLWVDEYSLVDASQWCHLCTLLYNTEPVQVILSGDWNQLQPVDSRYKGTAILRQTVQRSWLFWKLCGGHRLTLTECRRSANEGELFTFYSSLAEGGSREHTQLEACISEAMALFPVRAQATYYLCVSHAKRKAINRRLMNSLRPKGSTWLKKVAAPGLASEPQSMWIWAGQEVIICCRGTAHGLRHNTRDRIREISEHVVLESGVRLTLELASKHLRPPYACTYHSAQGLEFKGLLHLTDLQSPHLTRAPARWHVPRN